MNRGSMDNSRAEGKIHGRRDALHIRQQSGEFPQPLRRLSLVPRDVHRGRLPPTVNSTFTYQHKLLEPVNILHDEETQSEPEEIHEGPTWLPPRSSSRYPMSSVRTGSVRDEDEDVSYKRTVEAGMREIFANERQPMRITPPVVNHSAAGPSTQSRDIRATVGKVVWHTGQIAKAVHENSASKEEVGLLLLLGGSHHKDVLLEGRDNVEEEGQTTEDATEDAIVEGRHLKSTGLNATVKGKGKSREVEPASVVPKVAGIEKKNGKRPATRSAKVEGKARDVQQPVEKVKKIQASKAKAQPKTHKRKASSSSVSVPVLEEAAPPAKRIRFESETSAGSQDVPKLFISIPSKARLEEMLGRQSIWEVASASSSATPNGMNDNSPPLAKRLRNTISRSTRKH